MIIQQLFRGEGSGTILVQVVRGNKVVFAANLSGRITETEYEVTLPWGRVRILAATDVVVKIKGPHCIA